ncbi:hypothetical protein Hanom_Chr10g00906071 [Helianthus anomalus]
MDHTLLLEFFSFDDHHVVITCKFYNKKDDNINFLQLLENRVKRHFSLGGLGHFASLVQRFHFSLVGPKGFTFAILVHWINFIHFLY